MKVLAGMLAMAIGAAIAVALVAWVLMLLFSLLPWEQVHLSFMTTYVLVIILLLVRAILEDD